MNERDRVAVEPGAGLPVDHVGAGVGELAALGADVIDPEPRTGLDGNAVSFVHPDSVHGVLVEVIGG